MGINFEAYSNILKDLPQLPNIQVEAPTYFEIAGYPSLENVTSNILKFFLDPNEAHGLGTLFLKSLLLTAKAEIQENDLTNAEVNREVYTEKKYRIDLVVESPNMITGIENKLFANLNNDLDDYYSCLTKKSEGRRVLAVLLTLYPIDARKSTGNFIPITYKQYFDKLLSIIGGDLLKINNRYISFFLEFVRTINHLREENNMVDPAFIEWLEKHHGEVEKLYKQVGELKKELNSKAKRLGSLIDLQGYKEKGIEITQYIYDSFKDNLIGIDLVHDIKTKYFTLAIDTEIEVQEIYMEPWNRSKNSTNIREWLKRYKIPYENNGEKGAIFGKRFKYNDDLQIIQVQLQDLLDKVLKAVLVEKGKNK